MNHVMFVSEDKVIVVSVEKYIFVHILCIGYK